MKKNTTILYGQVTDYNQIIENNGNILSEHYSIISTLSEKCQGEIETSSDGKTKIRFAHPEKAIQLAINLSYKFHQKPKTPFKIGIAYSNLTDNIINEETALKLSEACPESSVLVAKEVVEFLDKDSNFNFIHVGSSLFKGATEPTEIYALVGSGMYIPMQNELSLGVKNKNSITILPFHNTSSEKELDYICDGIAEEIIDSLSKFKDLFVTARSSSFMFKNKEISIQDISRKLNVNYVLDGSIRKRNNEYRISYQLVDCSTGFNIITDTISSNFETLYDSEIKISRSIINFFKKDEPDTNQELENYISVDPTAYSYYLQGKHLSTNWQIEHVNKAVKLFEKTLEIVPDYAPALAGLSMTYIHMAINKFADFKESMAKSITYSDKSILADNTIPDGYIAKAIAKFWVGEWYVPDFEKNITSALTLSPCNAEIRMFNGMLFLFKGELARALSELQLAKQLDPHSVGIILRLGIIQYLTRSYEDAFNTFLTLPEAPKVKTYKYIRLAWCCILLKQYKKALEYVEQTQEDYEYYNMIYGIYLVVYRALKNESEFFKYKEEIEQQPENDPSKYYNLALLNKLMGKTEKSIEYLGKTLQNPLFMFTFMQYDEFWEDYHNHPLFLELVTSKYKGTGNQLIRIESETKEFLELKITDFLYAEAQDNYTLIVFKQKHRKVDKILRITLANVEKQLRFQDIFRCHRSYLINLTTDYTFHKGDHKAFLKNNELEITIPVSRSKEKEMKEILVSN